MIWRCAAPDSAALADCAVACESCRGRKHPEDNASLIQRDYPYHAINKQGFSTAERASGRGSRRQKLELCHAKVAVVLLDSVSVVHNRQV